MTALKIYIYSGLRTEKSRLLERKSGHSRVSTPLDYL
jgi:hypothetical protein